MVFQNNFLSAITKGQKLTKDNRELILPVGRLDQAGALTVYSEDYRARLNDALGSMYESVWSMIGDVEFFQLADAYRLAHPSQGNNLNLYGLNFPAFIKSHPLSDEYVFLAELAQFEQDYWLVVNSASDTDTMFFDWSLDQQLLLSATLILPKSFKLYDWDWAIYDLFQNREDNGSQEFIKPRVKQCVAMYKKNHWTGVKVLTEQQYGVLKFIKQGLPLVEVLDQVPIEPEDLQDLTQFLVGEQLIKPRLA